MGSKEISSFMKFFMDVMKIGCIPNHIALIIDGNRRYAARMKKEVQFGHQIGERNMEEMVKIIRYLGVRYCTFYIFSIENFNRSPTEVQDLMDLLQKIIMYYLKNIDTYKKQGYCIKFFGNTSMIPKNIYKSMCEIQMETRFGREYFLNFAIAYTSRDEITHSISTICNGLKTEVISESDVDESLLYDCTYYGDLPKVDLLIRTSGVVRFSDFLLLQISDALIIFMDCTWPEFNYLKCLYCIAKYQRCQQVEVQSNQQRCTEASLEFRKICKYEDFQRMNDLVNTIIE